MPPIPLVCLSKGRIEGTDEIAKGLIPHTSYIALLCTGEHPGVLLRIPELVPLADVHLAAL